MKKLLSLLLTLIFIITLSSCTKKTYIVVTDDSYPPFCYTDSEGNPIGFDIDLIKAVADVTDIKINIITVKGVVRGFEKLENGSADGFIGALNPNSELREKYDFSDYYYNDVFAFAVAKNKNKELISLFNEGVEKLKENGKYDELVKEYFG